MRSPELRLLLAQGFSPEETRLEGLNGFGPSESPGGCPKPSLKPPGAAAAEDRAGGGRAGWIPAPHPSLLGRVDRLCLPTLWYTQSFLQFIPLMLFSVFPL